MTYLAGVRRHVDHGGLHYALAAPDAYVNGLPVTSIGQLCVDDSSAIFSYSNGLPFTAAGRLATTFSAAAFHKNGWSFAASGRIARGSLLVDHYQAGFPFNNGSQSIVMVVDAPPGEGLPAGQLGAAGKFETGCGVDWTCVTANSTIVTGTPGVGQLTGSVAGTEVLRYVGVPGYSAGDECTLAWRATANTTGGALTYNVSMRGTNAAFNGPGAKMGMTYFAPAVSTFDQLEVQCLQNAGYFAEFDYCELFLGDERVSLGGLGFTEVPLP